MVGKDCIRKQARKGLVLALRDGYIYGKGKQIFHLSKGDLHDKAKQPSRYGKPVETTWIKHNV